jgi:hypothetical protein
MKRKIMWSSSAKIKMSVLLLLSSSTAVVIYDVDAG